MDRIISVHRSSNIIWYHSLDCVFFESWCSSKTRTHYLYLHKNSVIFLLFVDTKYVPPVNINIQSTISYVYNLMGSNDTPSHYEFGKETYYYYWLLT